MRAQLEFQRSLYHKPSNLRRRDSQTKEWTVSIDAGLFSHLGYIRNEVIATFNGIWRSQSEYEEICKVEPWRRAYSICKSEHGEVLDCYDNYRKGLCMASYSNCPTACWDIEKNRKPVPNCYITNHGDVIKLRCGYKRGSEWISSPKFRILPHEELLWNYGDSFVSYKQ